MSYHVKVYVLLTPTTEIVYIIYLLHLFYGINWVLLCRYASYEYYFIHTIIIRKS